MASVRFNLLLMICLGAGPLACFSSLAADLNQRQTQLEQLQAEINQQQDELLTTEKQRKALLKLLQQGDNAIANAAKKATTTRQTLKGVNRKITDLNLRQQQLEQQQQSQQQSLSKQLSSAYMSGDHDFSKMLINQESPAAMERMLVYYQYLNRARMTAIEQVKQTQQQITNLEKTQNQAQQNLQQLLRVEQAQQQQLTVEKSQRQQTFTTLNNTYQSKGAKLEQLQIDEADLKLAIEKAIAAINSTPDMKGLLAKKGHMPWPTQGSITTAFGHERTGKLKWKGVLLSAPEGQRVNAIASGRVIFADWLRGFGLMIIVDHGQGYMSLYGHAQTLLKQVGDNVSEGENLALVGLSGGQSKPGLYFEIRHKGQAVDPAGYCTS